MTVKVKETGSLDQSASQRTAVTLRVWNAEGRLGVVQLTSLSLTDLSAAVKTALEAAPLGIADNIPQIPLPVSAKTQSVVVTEPQMHPQESIESLAKELQEAVTALKNLDSSIQGVPYNAVSQTKVDHFYASTTGLTQAQSDSSVSAYIYARGQAEGFKPRAAGHWGEEVNLKDLNLLDIAKVAGESLIAHLRPVKIPSGKYLVVLSGRAFIDLLNAFSNLFSAQNIIDKQSLNTRESLGKELASAILNITDDPLHPWNIAPTRFDGEGTNVRRTPLVEKGVLTGLWHHSVSAKAFSTQSTGHARVAAKMSVGPWFYNIDAGAGLGDYASDCIWVEEVQALHAGVNALQGSFSLPFQGFRVQNGHKESLEGVTVAGDILSLLKSIVALSEAQERTPGGACPAVAVSELSITCES
ncbi:MAG: hypothetical protein RJB13_1531 [Pseudomonadota bacterium]